MVTKHTPGPWNVSEKDPTIVWASKGNNEPGICDTAAPTISQVSEKEAEANAKLIAAAPELLEALNEFLEWFNEIPEDTPFPKGMTMGMFLNAKKAIQKATT